MCKITTCINLGICHSYPIDNNTTQHTTREHNTMYKLQYRFKQQDNGRYTKWYTVSKHDSREDARKALGEHIAEFWTLSTRVVDPKGKTVGHYKYEG